MFDIPGIFRDLIGDHHLRLFIIVLCVLAIIIIAIVIFVYFRKRSARVKKLYPLESSKTKNEKLQKADKKIDAPIIEKAKEEIIPPSKTTQQEKTPTILETEEEKSIKAKKLFSEGDKYYKEGKYHGAISRYKVAMNLRPEYTNDACYNIGLSYHQARKYNAAIQYFQKVIDSNPEYANAYLGIGYAYKDSDNQAMANKYFQKWKELCEIKNQS